MTVLSNAALDLIFEPRGATTKRADVNLDTSGVDISNRYMDVSEGGTATAATTNIRTSGSDIATIFAELGTSVSLPDILWGGLVGISITASSPTVATASLTLQATGITSKAGAGTTLTDWLDSTGSGNGDDFECRYTAISGDTPSGPSTWTVLTSNQIFSVGGVVSKNAVFDVEIREIGGTTESRQVTLATVITGGGILE